MEVDASSTNIECEICGFMMKEIGVCKLKCQNCGRLMDCSDTH